MNLRNPERIGNNVESLRKKANQTQAELADSIKVTRQTIIAIEKGDYTPSVLLALKLAEHFKTSVEKVFYVQDV